MSDDLELTGRRALVIREFAPIRQWPAGQDVVNVRSSPTNGASSCCSINEPTDCTRATVERFKR
jgi:hypothetical protein